MKTKKTRSLIIAIMAFSIIATTVAYAALQTTLNIYSHYTKHSDKRASDTIENLLYAN